MVKWSYSLWVAWLVGIILMLGVVGVWQPTAVWQPIIAEDINQHRLDTALPAPQGDIVIAQTFTPRWDGLKEVELTLVRYGVEGAADNGRLTIQLLDGSGTVVAEQDLATNTLTHNQVYQLPLVAQPHSAGQTYTLRLSGSQTNPISAWGYSLNVYNGGELTLRGGPLNRTVPPTAVQELRFVTRYQLQWPDAWFYLGTMLYYEGALLLLALLFIPLPGLLLLLFGPRHWLTWDAGAFGGVALALGIAIWPILWFWLTLVNGRWSGWLLWLLFGLGWGVVIWRWRQNVALASSRILPVLKFQHLLLLGILVLSVAVRLLAVRGINTPPWVDASRHGLITAVMVAKGQTPSDYAPYLPVSQFPYHFGFHTLTASLQLMSGWPLPRLLLYLGQLLNGLMPLCLYAAVWLLVRRRNAALLAAFLVGLPFFFPGYYATWGRLTQLTALLIMPVLLAFTWLLLNGRWRWQSCWWLVGLLAAGLFLVHFRVFVFYIPFGLVAFWVSLRHFSLGRLGWLLGTAGLALLLLAPRLWQLWATTDPADQLAVQIPGYNAFPTSYLTTGWEYYFWGWAGGALLVVIVSLLLGNVRYPYPRWTTLPVALSAWVAGLFLLLAGKQLGLPETAVVNMNSMVITLFVPLALFGALTTDRLGRWLHRQRWLWQLLAYGLAGMGLTAVCLFGIRQQMTILNPQTILAWPQDLAGIRWVENNVPPTANIAVNSWQWLGNTWAGSDGGAWLTPLTGRATTTPPVDYMYDIPLFESIIEFNEQATAVGDWADPEQATWLGEQGIDYLFIGAKGGFFDPAKLARNPKMEIIYMYDGVFVFKVAHTTN